MSYEVRTVENGDNPFPRRLEKIRPRVDKLYYKGAFDEKLFENCLAVDRIDAVCIVLDNNWDPIRVDHYKNITGF